MILGGWAAWLFRRPPLVLSPENSAVVIEAQVADTVPAVAPTEPVEIEQPAPDHSESVLPAVENVASEERPVKEAVESTSFKDIRLQYISDSHPFRLEAAKVLNGHLEETDSVSRHKILSYCEHLRTSYTTRDIDFIRQVFSDNALIIVGHVVSTGHKSGDMLSDPGKVKYVIRSKQSYLEKLDKIFKSGNQIDVKFSDFKIMRHPTMEGIYGVTLRQKYACGSYSDDGYLFLLWDFRDRSMPLIHVRTWQPTPAISLGDDELIDISDFNLE